MNRVNNPPPGFVKLPRSLLAEDWAGKPAQLAVFVRLLLSASREPMDWHGIAIKRGQVVTSYASLSASCGLTIWAVRNALKELQEAGAARYTAHLSARSKTKGAARFAARGYTLVTICNFDSYEGINEEGRTLCRTPQKEDAARTPARTPATYKEDIRNNIDISSAVEDRALFSTEATPSPDPIAQHIAKIVTDKRLLPIVEDWLSYKRERRETYKSKKGITQFYNRLVALSEGNPEAARRLTNTAMANNWAGIFPERAAATSTPPRARTRIDIPAENAGDYVSTL